MKKHPATSSATLRARASLAAGGSVRFGVRGIGP
jgi:hypothetical protein